MFGEIRDLDKENTIARSLFRSIKKQYLPVKAHIFRGNLFYGFFSEMIARPGHEI